MNKIILFSLFIFYSCASVDKKVIMSEKYRRPSSLSSLQIKDQTIENIYKNCKTKNNIGDQLKNLKSIYFKNKRNSQYWNTLYFCNYTISKLNKAEYFINKAISISPKNIYYKNNLAMIYVKRHKYKQAFNYLKKISFKNKKYIINLNMLKLAFEIKRNWHAKLHKGDIDNILVKAMIELRKFNYKKAVTQLKSIETIIVKEKSLFPIYVKILVKSGQINYAKEFVKSNDLNESDYNISQGIRNDV